eukprot:scaffold24401_cov42-Cyclotella_meneghiniana.AAC.2
MRYFASHSTKGKVSGELLADGFDEDDCKWITRGITTLAETAKRMRMGEFMDSVDPDPDYNFVSNYNRYAPHCKEFSDALLEYQHTIDYMEHDTFTFTIGNSPLQKKVLEKLQDSLQKTHFHQLFFYNNEISGVGYIEFIANCVEANTRLQFIQLETVKIEHLTDIDVLCKAISRNGSLKEMIFQDCDTVEGVLREIFNKLKSKTVKKIHLDCSNLSDFGPNDMSEFLSCNPSLSELSLCNNALNEQDIVHMSNSLRQNTTLRKLLITHESPPYNWDLLDSIIFDSSNLNTAYYSNHHVCLEYINNFYSEVEEFNTCNDPIWNRRKKIYTILSRRNRSRTNAALFDSDGIGIKQIPQVLSLLKPFSEHHLHDEHAIQGDDEVVPLSIAYEIMRDWRMPELYNLDPMDED